MNFVAYAAGYFAENVIEFVQAAEIFGAMRSSFDNPLIDVKFHKPKFLYFYIKDLRLSKNIVFSE